MSIEQPCIVTIGGGSGQSTLLRHLKNYPLNITAIISMVDDGGSTGRLRQQLGVLPPGDVRRCLVALAQEHPVLQNAFEYRFEDGDLAGHTLGNIVLAALEKTTGDIYQATVAVSSIFHTKGTVIPVTEQSATLHARLQSGEEVVGETNIDIPKHDTALAIDSLYLEPKVAAHPAALQAISHADMIVFTIGDLFTSIIPNLLVTGIPEAIQHSKAKLVYTCNRSVKVGETHNFSALDFVKQLEYYIGKSLDDIILDSTPQNHLVESAIVPYNERELTAHGIRVHTASLSSTDSTIIDGKKLAEELFNLCKPSL